MPVPRAAAAPAGAPAATPAVMVVVLVVMLLVVAVGAGIVVPTRAAAAVLTPGTGRTAPTATVSPDPAHDLYVGTGGLVVPAHAWRGSTSGRSEAASCAECQWRVSVLCTKAEFADGSCRSIHIGCPVGTTPVRIWLLRPGLDWAVVGQACQGPGAPATVTDVGRVVRDRAEAALPPLLAAAQPAGGALVGVPVVLRTGQPAAGIRAADLSVLGLAVRLDSRVRWEWTYGDGASEWTSSPGGAYPDMSVSHTYRRAGAVTLAVVAVWRAQYTVEGLGPFVVPGPLLTQRQSVPVVVRAAHAHLVA